MTDIDKIRQEVQTYLGNANDMHIILMHRFVSRLEAKAAYMPKPKGIREPRVEFIKDWWTNLPQQQVLAIESAIAELNKGEGINDLKVKKLHPSWFQ